MNKNKTKAIIVVVFFILVAVLIISKGFGKETYALADVKLLDESNSNMYALYKKVDGVYQPMEEKTFPDGYELDLTESKCIDNNGNLVEEALEYKEGKVIFGGRLGEYKYYDMDAVIASVLDMCDKDILTSNR